MAVDIIRIPPAHTAKTDWYLATVLNVKIMEKRDGTTHSILRSF